MDNVILTYDTDRFSEILKEALNNNQVIIRDGVAYWKKGLESQGIIQHIPLKEVTGVTSDTFINTIGSLQSHIQNTIVAAQAISTATIMVATLVQTQILSQKIDAVRSAVLEVSQVINEQNIIFYTDKVSEYLSIVQNLKLVLEASSEDIKKIELIANNILSDSMRLKNHISYFILSLLNTIKKGQIKDENHLSLILIFIQQIMEILPVGMHLEHILSHRLGQYKLSQVLIENSNDKYEQLLNEYRNYLNEINNKIKYFEIKPQDAKYFLSIKEPALALVNHKIHYELLTKPANEQSPFLD